MPLLQTLDPVIMEQSIAAAIRDTLNSVSEIAQYCKVHTEERYPENDEEDIQISTVPDPVQNDISYTSIIQIGIPTVSERPYTSENYTQLTLTYPITFDAGFKDRWDNANGTAPFASSRVLVMTVYMKARAAIKADKTLGFDNLEHEYLLQESANTVEDEETGGRLHVCDWSLTVHVKGVVA
jgi:hypothetical protein